MRGHGSRTRYLLVEASGRPLELVLPKGHIEPQEDPRQTAVREVHEETGVWARIVVELEDVSHSVNGKVITARIYAMRAIGYGRRKDRQRGHRWLLLGEALNHDSPIDSETRQLLEAAAQQSARSDRA